MENRTISGRLADRITSLDLKQEAGSAELTYLKQLVMDTIACTVAGTQGHFAHEAVEHYLSLGGRQEAFVFGSRDLAPAAYASAVNAYLARNLTFDDVYEAGVVHPGSVVVMTALALGQALHSPVDEVMNAMAAGYEAVCRTAYAESPQQYDGGFHPTSTNNALGAAAVAARLMGLDRDQTEHALNIAGDTACGLRQFQIDGTVGVAAFHACKGAANGIEAAQLAARGFADPGECIGGRYGIYRMMAPGCDPDRTFAQEGLQFLNVSLKPYPSCRFIHGAVDAVCRCLKNSGTRAEDVDHIRIRTFSMAAAEGDRKELSSVLDAQYSIQYNVATCLLDGGLGLKHFTEAALTDERYPVWAGRISIEEAPEYSEVYPQKWPYEAEVLTSDGRTFSYVSDYPPGTRENPLDEEQLLSKWRLMMEPVVGREATELLISRVARLETLDSVDGLWEGFLSPEAR